MSAICIHIRARLKYLGNFVRYLNSFKNGLYWQCNSYLKQVHADANKFLSQAICPNFRPWNKISCASAKFCFKKTPNLQRSVPVWFEYLKYIESVVKSEFNSVKLNSWKNDFGKYLCSIHSFLVTSVVSIRTRYVHYGIWSVLWMQNLRQ